MVRVSPVRRGLLLLGLGALWMTLAACSSSGEVAAPTSPALAAPVTSLPATASATDSPPMRTPAQSPTQTSADLPEKPSPTPDCSDGLEFISDLTVPDGTLIGRGAQVDKRWQVKNIGTCNWDERYKLVLVQGPELGLPLEQALIPARAGKEALIRMLLIAPFSPGIYTSAWQAVNPLGEPFGDVIYIKFQVN